MKEIISKIPTLPGIYKMIDVDNNVIYVGKAINLKKRVTSYFNKSNKSIRIQNMVKLINNIEYVVVKNEVEALILECNYIKEYNPKFNVLLKDDKSFPYIKIDINSKYPTITMTRNKKEDKNMYFGPYTDVGSIKEVLKLIKEIFPIKRCKYNLNKSKVKPCLYYYINRCLGPCNNDISQTEYKDMINQIILFLKGKTNDIKNKIKKHIEILSDNLEFEKAEILKSRLDKIDKSLIKQSTDNLNDDKADIVGYILDKSILYIDIFKIRGYKIVFNESIKIDNIDNSDIDEVLSSCLSQYYNKYENPKKIYIKNKLNNFSEYFNDILVINPLKGNKLKLIEMVENNIKIYLNKEEIDLSLTLRCDTTTIECYDISNLGNDYIVGVLIRVDENKLNKKMYRKFKIKSTEVQNDVKCMKEVITRRINHPEWEFPKTIFIDGGKNQVNAVKDLLKDINVFGMIKDDKHRTKGLIDKDGNEIKLTKNELNYITFLQDETHRFAIKYHRLLRDKYK